MVVVRVGIDWRNERAGYGVLSVFCQEVTRLDIEILFTPWRSLTYMTEKTWDIRYDTLHSTNKYCSCASRDANNWQAVGFVEYISQFGDLLGNILGDSSFGIWTTVRLPMHHQLQCSYYFLLLQPYKSPKMSGTIYEHLTYLLLLSFYCETWTTLVMPNV